VHQAVEAAEATLDLAHRRRDLFGAGHVEFDDLTDIAHVRELARRALGQGHPASGPGQRHGGPLLQRPLGDAEGQRILGEHAGNQDTVMGQ
jgi:hypothetical protein